MVLAFLLGGPQVDADGTEIPAKISIVPLDEPAPTPCTTMVAAGIYMLCRINVLMVPETATPWASPGVSALPTIWGLWGSVMSTTWRPDVP